MKGKLHTIAIVFTSLDIGGIERKIVDLSCHYSSQKNVRLILLLKQHRGIFLKKIPNNVKVHFFTQRQHPLLNLFFPIWVWKQLLRLRPDFVLSFGNFSAICTIIANLFSVNTKVVISEDSSIDQQIKYDSHPLLRSILVRLTYPLSRGIIVLTSSAFHKMSQYVPAHKITILPNWLPINIPPPQPHTNRPIDILFIGRLVHQKDPLRFLRICKIIQKKIPHLSITMIGDGNLKTQVENFISTNNLQVDLLPANTPVQDYYQRSKTFVLTSVHEGFPLTILESFYYYCPAFCPVLEEVKSFYKHDPKSFLYNSSEAAVKLISIAILEPSLIQKNVQQYHSQIVDTRDQNFHDTLDYLQRFL